MKNLTVKNATLDHVLQFMKTSNAASSQAQWALLGVILRNDDIERDRVNDLFGNKKEFSGSLKSAVNKLVTVIRETDTKRQALKVKIADLEEKEEDTAQAQVELDKIPAFNVYGVAYTIQELYNVEFVDNSPPFSIAAWYAKYMKENKAEKDKNAPKPLSKEDSQAIENIFKNPQMDVGMLEDEKEFKRKLRYGTERVQEGLKKLVEDQKNIDSFNKVENSQLLQDKTALQAAVENPQIDTQGQSALEIYTQLKSTDSESVKEAQAILEQAQTPAPTFDMPSFATEPEQAQELLTQLLADMYEHLPNGEAMLDGCIKEIGKRQFTQEQAA